MQGVHLYKLSTENMSHLSNYRNKEIRDGRVRTTSPRSAFRTNLITWDYTHVCVSPDLGYVNSILFCAVDTWSSFSKGRNSVGFSQFSWHLARLSQWIWDQRVPWIYSIYRFARNSLFAQAVSRTSAAFWPCFLLMILSCVWKK